MTLEFAIESQFSRRDPVSLQKGHPFWTIVSQKTSCRKESTPARPEYEPLKVHSKKFFSIIAIFAAFFFSRIFAIFEGTVKILKLHIQPQERV